MGRHGQILKAVALVRGQSKRSKDPAEKKEEAGAREPTWESCSNPAAVGRAGEMRS